MISSGQENLKSISFYRRNKLTIYLVQQLLANLYGKYMPGVYGSLKYNVGVSQIILFMVMLYMSA